VSALCLLTCVQEDASAASAANCGGGPPGSLRPCRRPHAGTTPQHIPGMASSVASRCATDVLAGALGFLSLSEFNAAAQVCKAWLVAASQPRAWVPSNQAIRLLAHQDEDDGTPAEEDASVESEPPQWRWTNAPFTATLEAIFSSPLRHRCVALDCGPLIPVNLSFLRALSERLPRLLALGCCLNQELHRELEEASAAGEAEQFVAKWPPALRELGLGNHGNASGNVVLLRSLTSITQLTSLALTSWWFEADSDADRMLADWLRRLPHLREIWLGPVTPTQIAALKNCAHMRRLYINGGEWEPEQFVALFEPPHQLHRLRTIVLGDAPLTLGVAQLLPASLTALEPAHVDYDCFAHFSRCPLLRRLRLQLERGPPEPDEEAALVEALRACPNLKMLTLAQGWDQGKSTIPSTFELVPALCTALPQLEELELFVMPVTSLAVLARFTRLRRLYLLSCWGLSNEELLSVGAVLPTLKALEVRYTCGLSAEEQAQLRPPSQQLPALQRFEYTPPN